MNYPMYNPYYQNQQPIQQTQTNGFVSVPNESVARNYPVAYGNSVTFKDENAPYVYTKTMGFSQLETPRFEKYKLVKEEPTEEEPVLTSKSGQESIIDLEPIKSTIDGLKSKVATLEDVIDTLKEDIEALKKNDKKKKSNGED